MRNRNTSHVHSIVPTRSCLTGRSTGPIAACRHLGYESLVQMPPRHNGPVSYDVRHLNPEDKSFGKAIDLRTSGLLCARRQKTLNAYSLVYFVTRE